MLTRRGFFGLTVGATFASLVKMRADPAVPVGMIVAYTGATIPDGWFPCDGRTFSRTAYPGLYAALGGTYGGGVPDLRGRVFGVADSTASGFGYVIKAG